MTSSPQVRSVAERFNIHISKAEQNSVVLIQNKNMYSS